MINYGDSTLNARSDYDITVTLSNHVTMVTARPVMGTDGHNWSGNTDPSAGQTIHTNKGSYVSSVFDVVHDNGMRTGLFVGKSKLSLLNTSYDSTNGADDTIFPDYGKRGGIAKLDAKPGADRTGLSHHQGESNPRGHRVYGSVQLPHQPAAVPYANRGRRSRF